MLIERHSEVFWNGYRAFVYGGKNYTFTKTGKLRYATGGIDPPAHLSDFEKAEWQKGIEKGKTERIECRQLTDKNAKAQPKLFYERQKRRLKTLLKENPFASNAFFAQELGVSASFISTTRRQLCTKFTNRRSKKTKF